MYQDLYDLKENPFNSTSDPEYFYLSANHSDAFSNLVYGIQQRKGILVVTGEVGTGKTTLCRTFLNRVDNNVRTALILNPFFTATQLLHMILKDLGVEGHFRNKMDLIEALNKFLLEETALNHNVVVIIDEAQNLKVNQLEQIRLLSNLETEKHKLLQIILVGQPELLIKLRLKSLRQLNQRISVRFNIQPLGADEIGEYIHHRIKVGSRSGNGALGVEFTPTAVQTIYQYSMGIPRLINILCDRALLAGYVQEIRQIDEDIVSNCVQEVVTA